MVRVGVRVGVGVGTVPIVRRDPPDEGARRKVTVDVVTQLQGGLYRTIDFLELVILAYASRQS